MTLGRDNSVCGRAGGVATVNGAHAMPQSQVHLTPTRLDQLRRDAKRLGRERGVPHAQALDAIAVEHGFSNWSLLAKSAAASPPTLASVHELGALGLQDQHGLVPEGSEVKNSRLRSAADVPEVGFGNIPVRMDASRTELQTIRSIAERFEALRGADRPVDRLSLMMDLEACHCNACPLDLAALLMALRDIDFIHDVAGISRHLNRDTGQLEDYFRPRYAAQLPAREA